MKAKLAAISWEQTQPGDCSHMVVFAARKGISAADVEKYIARIMAVRGAPAAALLGVDACPMEGLVAAEYDKLLGLDELGYTTVMGGALGTHSADEATPR